jgi:hypothetical protein
MVEGRQAQGKPLAQGRPLRLCGELLCRFLAEMPGESFDPPVEILWVEREALDGVKIGEI